MRLKMKSGKWQPFCLSLNMLTMVILVAGADQQNNNNAVVRPASLGIEASGDVTTDSEKRITYMEIPQHDNFTKPPSPPSPEKEKPKKPAGSPGEGSAAPAMAFTIDFGDEESSKLSMGQGLSKFLPKKVRKSFRTRATRMRESREAEDLAKVRGVSLGLILGLHPANERCRYKVTASLIGWAQI